MGKYGKWGGRQKPRRYGKLCRIFLFVCIYLCVPGPPHMSPPGWASRPAGPKASLVGPGIGPAMLRGGRRGVPPNFRSVANPLCF
eukprot:1535539-Pyramimonas_sp.AAC.1